MSIGQGVRLAVQAAYFMVIARSLGAVNYGAFVAVSALIGIAYPFGALGSGSLLIKEVAPNASVFARSWGAALLRACAFGSLLTLFVCGFSDLILPREISHGIVVLIAISDIVGLNLILLSAQAFQSLERLNWTSVIYVLISASRLAAALLLVGIHPHPTALEWSYAYCGSTGVVAVFGLSLVTAKLGWPAVRLRDLWSKIREGSYFASSLSAQTVYNDLDKTMLARLGSLDATGIYGAAYRVIEVSFSPILALLNAAYPSFFRIGQGGIEKSIEYAKPLLRRSLFFSASICITLIAAAGLLPVLLGKQFHDGAEALRWLAFILPLRTIHAFLCDVLTSVGRQGTRTGIQIGVAFINAAVNMWLIPAYSWRGAAWSSLACDGLLAVVAAAAVKFLVRSGKRKRESLKNPSLEVPA
jgi:O-antigen/teichoic acid export membrane protein